MGRSKGRKCEKQRVAGEGRRIPPLVALSQTGTLRAKHKAETLLGYLRENRGKKRPLQPFREEEKGREEEKIVLYDEIDPSDSSFKAQCVFLSVRCWWNLELNLWWGSGP
ncbi:hypothetical protein GBA52_022099 [Prunus armeniaca]|nr:hypothetical protein GBA52_022099 [Prunus armeniaca]